MTKISSNNTNFQEKFLKKPLRVQGLLMLIFITQGLWYTQFNFNEIKNGLWQIITTPDMLVADSIAIGGIGAAFINVGLTGLLAIAAMKFAQHEANGREHATLGLVTGFAFFGKNPINMLPILFGGWLHSKFTGIPHKDNVLPSLLATCLAPVVTKLAMSGTITWWVGLIIGIGLGIFIGFIIHPFGNAMRKTHDSCNLYNIGFASGLIGLCIFALFRMLGIDYAGQSIWSEGYDVPIARFLAIASTYLIFCGFLSKGEKLSLRRIILLDAPDLDFYNEYKENVYINMGLLGFASLGFVLLTNGDFSGPVVGAALSVVGFGAFGKALHTSGSVVLGAVLAAVVQFFITGIPYNSRNYIVAALFSTCLSPLARRFGYKWGVAAGFLHLTLAGWVDIFHGGLNLYNNGFAGGIAAMVLLPIILFFRERGEPS